MNTKYKAAKEIRRENLKLIVSRYASAAEAAKDLKRSEAQINNLLSGRENIGDSLARAIEKAAKEPYGWLDSPPPNMEALKRAVVRVLELSKSAAHPDLDLLAEQAIEVYAAECRDQPIDKVDLLRKYTALTYRLLKK